MSTNNQAPNENTAVQTKPLDIIEQTLVRVHQMQTEGKLMLPKNYSVENSLRSAWLIIQQTVDMNKRPALEVCTGPSVANALFEMILKGLNPTKKQCYFVVFGNKLNLQQSYFGTIAISKRVAGVEDAVGVPIYANDKFKYTIDISTGKKTVTEHDQEFDNIDITKLKGAYAVVTYLDGHKEYEIMTMQQIRSSWEMGAARGNSPAHKNFPDQMAAKTVVARALKLPVNTSNDDDLFEPEEINIKNKQVEEAVKQEIAQHGNKDEIGFDDVQQAEVVPAQLNNQSDILEDVRNIGAQLNNVESKLTLEQQIDNRVDNRFYRQTEAAYQEDLSKQQVPATAKQITAPFA